MASSILDSNTILPLLEGKLIEHKDGVGETGFIVLARLMEFYLKGSGANLVLQQTMPSTAWRGDFVLVQGAYEDSWGRLCKGQPIEVRVQTTIARTDGTKQGTYITVLLMHDPDRLWRPHVSRNGLPITEACSGQNRSEYIVEILVDDDPIAEFVGDAEDPSHRKLNTRELKTKYENADRMLEFVTGAAVGILKRLRPPDTKINRDAFADFLPAPGAVPAAPDPPLAGKGKGGMEIPHGNSDDPVCLSYKDGVLEIGQNGDIVPRRFIIKASFHGLPHDRNDFDFKNMEDSEDIEYEGIKRIEALSSNRLLVIPKKKNAKKFRLTIKGLDDETALRQLDVRVRATLNDEEKEGDEE
jgi:hypothetical protein